MSESDNEDLVERFSRLATHRHLVKDLFTIRLSTQRLFLFLLAENQALSGDTPRTVLHLFESHEYYSELCRLRYRSTAYKRLHHLTSQGAFYRRRRGPYTYFRLYADVRRALQQALALTRTHK